MGTVRILAFMGQKHKRGMSSELCVRRITFYSGRLPGREDGGARVEVGRQLLLESMKELTGARHSGVQYRRWEQFHWGYILKGKQTGFAHAVGTEGDRGWPRFLCGPDSPGKGKGAGPSHRDG